MYSKKRDSNKDGCMWKVAGVVGGVVALLVLLYVLMAYTPVKFGTVKAVKRFGALTGEVFEPGLNWKVPLVDGTEKVRMIVLTYETSDNPDQSDADFTDFAVKAQTVDGQQITVKFSLQFRIDDPLYVLENYGHEREVVENIVKTHSRSLSRLAAQQYTAEQLYGGTDIFKYAHQVAYVGVTVVGEDGAEIHHPSLEAAFNDNGVIMVEFLVRKIDFSPEYIDAIENQQIAEENIETAKYQAEQAEYDKQRRIRELEADAEGRRLEYATEAERSSLMARTEADNKRVAADAAAYELQTLADAQATSIDMVGAALKKNPEIVQYEFVRNLQDVNWGIMPSDGITMLLPTPPTE